MSNIIGQLNEQSFCYQGSIEKYIESYGKPTDWEETEEYQGWTLRIIAPNQGILGIDIFHPEHGGFSADTHEKLGYYDSEPHFQFAKQAISNLGKINATT